MTDDEKITYAAWAGGGKTGTLERLRKQEIEKLRAIRRLERIKAQHLAVRRLRFIKAGGYKYVFKEPDDG